MKIQMNIPPNRPPLGVRTIVLFEALKLVFYSKIALWLENLQQ